MLNYQSGPQLNKLARAITKLGEEKGRQLQLGEVLDAIAQGQGLKGWSALAPLLSQSGIEATLTAAELAHMQAAIEHNLKSVEHGEAMPLEERTIQAHSGFFLKVPVTCDYVRVCDPLGREIMRWTSQDWHNAPEQFLASLIATLQRGVDAKPPKSAPMPLSVQPESIELSRVPRNFWPVDDKLSRKELQARIGLMNFELTALRAQNAQLIKKTKAQRQELTAWQTRPFKVPAYWKLVPEVADDNMKNAAHNRFKFDGTFVSSFIWDAMLAEAPTYAP